MNKKQSQTRASKMSKHALEVRRQLFPKLDVSKLWNRKTQKGFATIPRTMPLLQHIMDDLSPKGKPVSQTYLALWSRAFDESLVTISSPGEVAFESGFSGQRAINTWTARMRILEKLGFITSHEGPVGEFNYVVLLNPYEVVKALNKQKKIQSGTYSALLTRCMAVGATDLNE